MSRIDRGPTEEAVLNPYFTDERLFKNAVMRAELAEAEVERLRTALVAIQSTTPGSAHRIAIQALAERGTE